MPDGSLETDDAMVASYSVTITGIQRTRNELKRLSNAIQSLRKANYQTMSDGRTLPMTVAAQLGGQDVFVTELDNLEGRIQTSVRDAMAAAMAKGRRAQAQVLDAAVTTTGEKRFAAGHGHSAGRNLSGDMIAAIKTNVETSKTVDSTQFVGWHGWPIEGRSNYFEIQEKKGHRPPAADSLGKTIPLVREFLKTELGKLHK